MGAQHTPDFGAFQIDAHIRIAYEKQYPEMRGIAGTAARNHYASFKTGWLCAVAAIAKATRSDS